MYGTVNRRRSIQTFKRLIIISVHIVFVLRFVKEKIIILRSIKNYFFYFFCVYLYIHFFLSENNSFPISGIDNYFLKKL